METVRAFLERQMEMDPEAVKSLEISSSKRLFKKPNAKSPNRCQTVVTFGSIYARDLVMGHASNLPEGCSIDIVIPDYLLSLKKYMDHFAFKVRRHTRVSHQTKFSTSIRMDDVERTLYLAT